MIKLTDLGLSEINMNRLQEKYEGGKRNSNLLVVLDSSDSDDAPLKITH